MLLTLFLLVEAPVVIGAVEVEVLEAIATPMLPSLLEVEHQQNQH